MRCGKRLTTFIDAITGFVPTSAGSAIFNGSDLSQMKPHERAQLGLVRTFQSLELFEDLSVRDNLLVAAHPTSWYTLLLDVLRIGQSNDEIEKRIEWALEVAGLTGLEEELPTDLPHGQRKLVGVARALAAQPRLLVCDEPTSALDVSIQAQILNLLKDLQEQLNLTILFISHDLPVVRQMCDRIGVLKDGKLCEVSNTEELFLKPQHDYTKKLLHLMPKIESIYN